MNNSELSPTQILERVKPDRVTLTKPEEDRRRRTIIVEKKNGSYGFTLQSYGIHYKKEQEIEMITYVDHVDYDGPAFRAGMREGDVILSINGCDMEKADHKSLVNFIKSCDTRMRMVVLFEDCVRKVELHMKYIRLQNALKIKTLELEKLCLKEKEIISGKWKTHSLPARKKTGSADKSSEYGHKVPINNEEHNLKRSTVSTEDVGQNHHYQPPMHQHFLIAYPRHPPYYVDVHGRTYYLHPSTVTTPSSSKEYLVKSPSNWLPKQQLEVNQNANYHRKDSNRRKSSYNNEEIKHNNMKENLSNCYRSSLNQCSKALTRSSNSSDSASKKKDGQKVVRSKSYHQHICGGCLRGEKNGAPSHQENQETVRLEAYDLASSPCCSAQCVPTRRRRSHSQHLHKIKQNSSKTFLQFTNLTKDCNNEGYSNRSIQVNIPVSFHGNGNFLRKYSKGESARSLDPSSTYHLVSQNSLHSCTSNELPSSRKVGEQSAKSYTTYLSTDTLYWDQSNGEKNFRKHSTHSSSGRYRHHQEFVKPVKSWDNLTAKSRGCEYLDTETGKSYSTKNVSQMRQHDRYFNNATKSSESLFYSQNLSDASFSCEYLDQHNPTFISNEDGRFVAVMPNDITYQRNKSSQTDSNKKLVDVPQTPEITRL